MSQKGKLLKFERPELKTNAPAPIKTYTSIKELLDEQGATVPNLTNILFSLTKINTVKFDKHGNPYEVYDGKLALEAIKVLLELHGKLGKHKVSQETKKIEDLFEKIPA